MRKTITGLLIIAFVLTGCGGSQPIQGTSSNVSSDASSIDDAAVSEDTESEPSDASKAEKEEKSENEPVEEAVDVRTALETYAEEITYLKDRSFNGYIYFEDLGYKLDWSEIPAESMNYHIDDFDNDGDEELLLVGFSEDYNVKLSMYEYRDGDISVSDELVLDHLVVKYEQADSETTIGLEECGISDLGDDYPPLINCFLYGDAEKIIGIEFYTVHNVIADGVHWQYAYMSYSEDHFQTYDACEMQGSEFYFDDPEFKMWDIPVFTSRGLSIPWEELCYGETSVAEHAENYQNIACVSVSNLLSSEEYYDIYGKTERTKCLELHVYKE